VPTGENPLPGQGAIARKASRRTFSFSDEARSMIDHPDYFALEHGAFVLRGFALRYGEELLRGVAELQKAPLNRHAATPSGLSMSGDSTTCFHLGWTTIERSKDHLAADVPRAAIPDVLRRLGRDAGAIVGFSTFAPDVSLDSHASPGARVSLHQEMNWPEGGAPIVAFVLGTPSAFLLKKHEFSVDARRVNLWHGDVIVWGPTGVA
jgi:alkylated DNA repair protein (DNA oxidative demethylase)